MDESASQWAFTGPAGEASEYADATLVELLNLHTNKRRLILMKERRERLFQSTADLETALDLNRLHAVELLASLKTVADKKHRVEESHATTH